MAVSLAKPPIAVTKCPTGATSGITTKQWQRLVRGESEPLEIPSAARIPGKLRLRCGHGAVA